MSLRCLLGKHPDFDRWVPAPLPSAGLAVITAHCTRCGKWHPRVVKVGLD